MTSQFRSVSQTVNWRDAHSNTGIITLRFIMPPKRRAAVGTQQKITDSGLKTSKKRRVIQKPVDLTKSQVKLEKKARSTSPSEDIALTADDDELQKEDEIVHTGIDDDLELRKRRQPAAKPKVIESEILHIFFLDLVEAFHPRVYA
jgi:hypothetical protein